MNHLNNWENDLQRRLANHRAVPPADGWDKLEQALTPPVHRLPFWRRPAFYVPAASAAACLALVLLIDRPGDTELPQQLAHEVQSAAASAPAAPLTVSSVQTAATSAPTAVPTQAARTVAALPEEGAPAAASRMEAHAVSDFTETRLTETEAADCKKESEATLRPAQTPGQQPPSAQTTEEPAEGQERKRTASATFRKANLAQAHRALSKRSHRPTFSLRGNLMPAQRICNDGYYAQAVMDYTRGQGYRPNHFITSPGKADMMLLIAKNVHRKVQTEVNHHTPVRAGLNVTVPLNARWSVGTGLTYTLLKTDILSGSEESYFRTALRLHYVGIPLQASFTFFQSRPFNAYATAGFMLEKCVKGKSTTLIHVTDSYKSGTESAKDLGRGLWQASFRAAAGMQFNVTRHVGLYFEPGVSYFVPDQSSLPSIRHDRPWQFDMEAGLRLTFGK